MNPQRCLRVNAGGIGLSDRLTHNVGVNSQKEAPNTASPATGQRQHCSVVPLSLARSSFSPVLSQALQIRLELGAFATLKTRTQKALKAQCTQHCFCASMRDDLLLDQGAFPCKDLRPQPNGLHRLIEYLL